MIEIPGRIPIRIYPIFWMLIIVLGWLNSATVTGTLVWAAVILVSVLIHEYGHALTALAFGQSASIELVGLGGVTQRQGKRLRLWQEFLIVLNGPMAGFGLFLLASWIYENLGNPPPKTLWTYAISITVLANLFWTIINLLPLHPLDGGKLLSIILESLFGIKGVRAAMLLSSIIGLLGSLFLFSFGSLLGGALFMILAFESYKAWRSSLYIEAHDQDENLVNEFQKAEEEIHSHQLEAAKQRLENIRSQTQQGILYISSTEYLARILAQEGKWKEVYEQLLPLEKVIHQDVLQLLHEAAYRVQEHATASRIGSAVYQLQPRYEVALRNAQVHAEVGEIRAAEGWFRRAIEDGLPDYKEILQKPEFAAIRGKFS